MHKRAYYIVNGITLYRLVIAPVLLVLIITHELNVFKWMLPVSFLTDAIDGYLARQYQVVSKFGAKMDSVADNFTILVAITGLFVFKWDFVRQEMWIILVLLTLYAIQTLLAFIRYGRISSFHTYLAKVAAVLQALFLLTLFLKQVPLYFLFYAMACITAVELLEEMILVYRLPSFKTDVKGLYWVLKRESIHK